MRILHRFSTILFCGALMLLAAAAVLAQETAPVTKEQALKDLQKTLVKNSRYQVQEVLVNFKPLSFKTCEVTYTFERPDAIGGENFGRATMDSTSTASTSINSSSSGTQTMSSITGNTSSIKSNNDPNFRSRESTFFNSQKTTAMNLSDIDITSFQVQSNNKGTLLYMKTLENRTSIVRTTKGNGAAPGASSSEIFPIVSEKKVEDVKAAIVQAVKACQAPK